MKLLKRKTVKTTKVAEKAAEVVPTPIALLELDLGRQDLNTLVDKVNELIRRAN